MATTKPTDDGDAPLIELADADIKKLIAKAKKKGYVTYEELNAALPQDMGSDQIEDIQTALSEMGVQIVENDEEAENEEGREDEVEEVADDDDDTGSSERKPTTNVTRKLAAGERTDDPVRMYLREMGAVELLSREGEIAIAKRIEAGRDMMIMGLCESPITFHAIIQWSDALNAGEMQLREILDLDAMLSKEPPADKMTDDAEEEDDDGEISEATAGPTIREEEEVEDEPAARDEDDEDGDAAPRRREEEEDEDNTMSLAQMEA
ncbi:MAG: RNA polymerase sigma factor RpoD, partial [Alphaproteobacteria bacterium]